MDLRGGRFTAVVALSGLTAAAAAGLIAYSPLGPAGRVMAAGVAFGAYAALFSPRVRRGLTAPSVLAAIALLVAVAVVTPPRGSHDVWSYAMYGRILSVHHGNPFTQVPAAFPHDPLLHLVGMGWRHTASVYGPGFVALAGIVTSAAGSSPLATRLLFQLVEALALAGVLALVWRRTRSAAALAFVGLNPLVLVVVNGGHNDLLAGLALLAGTLLLVERRPRLAGFVLALGALVKLVLLLPIVALVVWAWRRREGRAAVEVAAASGTTLLVAYGIAGGTAALAPLLHARGQHSRASLWQLPVRMVLQQSGRPAHGAFAAVGDVALVTIAVVAALVVLGVTRGAPRRAPHADLAGAAVVAGAVMVVYLLAASYDLPWYSAWALPVLALAWRSRAAVVGALQTVLVGVAYAAPLATSGWFGSAFRVYARVVVPVVAVVALGVLVRAARRDRLPAPPSSSAILPGTAPSRLPA